MANFAVIDTETNWNDRVMSIGVVIADTETLQSVESVYHILTPEYQVGGMYESTYLPMTVCALSYAADGNLSMP